MKTLLKWYVLLAALFTLFSFGFIDPNFTPIMYGPLMKFIRPLMYMVYQQPKITTLIYISLLCLFFILYAKILFEKNQLSLKKHGTYIVLILFFFFCSYPALSYDIFNYILTAKVTFLYRENPYMVMPIEFIGEPMLAYTRAANKVALYGPTWILVTWLPHMLSAGNVVVALYTFKLFVAGSYIGVCWVIYRLTKDMRRVIFFAANPLVIIETFISGHNDIFMMFLALLGIYVVRLTRFWPRIFGWIALIGSVFVKGATIVLIPVFLFFSALPIEKIASAAAALLFGVFLLTPLREELYPWYATWWLVFVALIPMHRYRSFVHGSAFAFSFGLMLRYIPWMYTREYGGTGPLIRIIVTFLPVGLFVFWRLFTHKKNVFF